MLDGEAWPTGGMGLAKQMKDELPDCPPTLVLVARKVDAWLATWSQADGVVAHPLDPVEITGVAADLLRRRAAGADQQHRRGEQLLLRDLAELGQGQVAGVTQVLVAGQGHERFHRGEK